MVKGCQRKIIQIKDTGNELFSEAYFVLSDIADQRGDTDIVREAGRLLATEPWNEEKRPSRWWQCFAVFFAGFLSCGVAVLCCFWLF